MRLRQLWGFASTGLVLTMACAAWAWRDCMLLALSVVLAYRLFLLHMDRGAPLRHARHADRVACKGRKPQRRPPSREPWRAAPH